MTPYIHQLYTYMYTWILARVLFGEAPMYKNNLAEWVLAI